MLSEVQCSLAPPSTSTSHHLPPTFLLPPSTSHHPPSTSHLHLPAPPQEEHICDPLAFLQFLTAVKPLHGKKGTFPRLGVPRHFPNPNKWRMPLPGELCCIKGRGDRKVSSMTVHCASVGFTIVHVHSSDSVNPAPALTQRSCLAGRTQLPTMISSQIWVWVEEKAPF